MQSLGNREITETSTLTVIVSGIHQFLYSVVRAATTRTAQFVRSFVQMGISSAKCLSAARLDGKTAIITGCNTGIGKVTAQDLFQRGARVILACRNLQAANAALEDIKKESANKQNCGELCVRELDLSDLESVRKCAKNLLQTEDKINLLINNAGVMMCPELRTADGFEMQIGTNHFGHFLLTLLLLPKIIESKPARIVNVSSMAHNGGKIDLEDINWEKRTYKSLGAYKQSKLANILFTKELARRLKEKNISGVNVYSLHPGVIATELGRHLNQTYPVLNWTMKIIAGPFVKTPEQGAQTSIYCAVDETCENETGLYYAECRVKEPSSSAKDMGTAEKLWDLSCKLVNIEDSYNPFKVAK